MNTSGIQHIVLDFVGTVAVLEPSRESILRRYLDEVAGICLDVAALSKGFATLDFVYPYSSIMITEPKHREQFYLKYNSQLLQFLGVSHLVNSEDLFEYFRNVQPHWRLRQEVPSLLSSLQERGYRVTIASNFDSNLPTIVNESLRLESLVATVLTSQNLGVEKPDIAFFREVLRRLRVNGQDLIYIGDSYTLDFIPPRSIGWQTRLLDETGQFAHIPEAFPTLKLALQEMMD